MKWNKKDNLPVVIEPEPNFENEQWILEWTGKDTMYKAYIKMKSQLPSYVFTALDADDAMRRAELITEAIKK